MAKYINGVYTCDNQQEISNTPRDDDFKVQDDDQDGDWRYFRNGNFLGFYGLGPFVTGTAVANSERKSDHSDASMYGNFRGLDRMNSSQDWVGWNNPAEFEDSDPDFRLCIRSDTHVEMQDSPC